MTDFLTLTEVAERLHVSRRTVEREVKAGRIRIVKVRGGTRVTERELAAYVAALVRAA